MNHQLTSQPLTLEQIRRVDKIAIDQFGISGLVLMENAGRGAADVISDHSPSGGRCVVLCGTGNNGGDGMVIARHLHAKGIQVTVLVAGSRSGRGKLSPDCRVNLEILEKTRVPILWCADEAEANAGSESLPLHIRNEILQADTVVDALLGTGAKGAPRDSAAQLIRTSSAISARRFAIDIPSGLDTETGLPADPTFLADITVTFVAEKPCFRKPTARAFLGTVVVLPIGIPPEVIDVVLAELGHQKT
ncbi:NAD(P)H-hydrate epimerase [Pirellulaceae bacterium SH449]